MSDRVANQLATQRPRWVGWAIAATIPLLIAAVCAALWLAMPLWLARLVVEYSPWFEPAFRATAYHLRDDNLDPRLVAPITARWAKQLQPPEVEFLFVCLDDGNAGRRTLAAALIAYHYRRGILARTPAPGRGVPSLVRMLGEDTALARLQAARALMAVGVGTHLPAVLAAIAETPPALQPNASALLADMNNPESATLLLRWSYNEPVQTAVVFHLGRISDPRIVDRLLELLIHPRAEIRKFAILATATNDDSRLTGALAKACLDPDTTVHLAALEHLCARTNALDLLFALMDNPAAAAIHSNVMAKLLDARAAELTPEQRERLQRATKAEDPPTP